jgi:hypothetical protein
MKQYEFQFRWGGIKRSFGLDVMAGGITEAVEKANHFLDQAVPLISSGASGVERVWINVTDQATERDIAIIYDGEQDYTVKRFKALELCGLHNEEHCSVCWQNPD